MCIRDSNRTLSLDIEMEETVLEGEVVTVEVNRLAQKKDQTGTIKNISGDEINALPVENVGAVVNMQAGVVNGHFRGGRNTEVTYMIDGVQVDEAFGGGSATVEIQPEAVQDLEVITGTFNAEYGNAMSGVVNQVTKSGSNTIEGVTSTWTGMDLENKPNFTITNPGGAFQYTESYSGPGLATQTIIQRVTDLQSVTETTSTFSQ